MINRLHVKVLMVVLGMAAFAQSQTFITLSFLGPPAVLPSAGVIEDQSGNLYGTADGVDNNCVVYPCGAVYEVDTAGNETVLYIFCGVNCADGAHPEAPMVQDEAGNLYGTTYAGGSGSGCNYYGCGTVFKVNSAGNETVLYSFGGGSDGCLPLQGLVLGESDTLFGTTSSCGTSGMGTIFKVDSAGNFTVLHSFTGKASDGAYPANGHLTMDRSGNLYGVTAGGGAYGGGVLYRLSTNGKHSLIRSFGGASDGCNPFGSVVQDAAGNFYGTTAYCGSRNHGMIWKVSKQGKETILHRFAGDRSDGCTPYAGVAQDTKGNLYGVTTSCGANGYGALYKLNAHNKLTLLHSFDFSDGADPVGEVLRTTTGTLFGTTYEGGIGDCGSVGCGTLWSYAP